MTRNDERMLWAVGLVVALVVAGVLFDHQSSDGFDIDGATLSAYGRPVVVGILFDRAIGGRQFVEFRLQPDGRFVASRAITAPDEPVFYYAIRRDAQ
jgi:hypothetical protein